MELSFGYPTEVVEEGRISVLVPNLKVYFKEEIEPVPSKAPVFFNPTMELNRDLAVLALQTYQKMVGNEVSVCEPLTGCGIRGIRFAEEVNKVRKIVLGDINPRAAELAQLNVRRNELEDRVFVMNEDANLL